MYVSFSQNIKIIYYYCTFRFLHGYAIEDTYVNTFIPWTQIYFILYFTLTAMWQFVVNIRQISKQNKFLQTQQTLYIVTNIKQCQ